MILTEFANQLHALGYEVSNRRSQNSDHYHISLWPVAPSDCDGKCITVERVLTAVEFKELCIGTLEDLILDMISEIEAKKRKRR
jgi:hypothetical protein